MAEKCWGIILKRSWKRKGGRSYPLLRYLQYCLSFILACTRGANWRIVFLVEMNFCASFEAKNTSASCVSKVDAYVMLVRASLRAFYTYEGKLRYTRLLVCLGYQCCESGMFIPDPGSWFAPSRILDLRSRIQQQQKEEWEKFCRLTLLYFWTSTDKNLSQFTNKLKYFFLNKLFLSS